MSPTTREDLYLPGETLDDDRYSIIEMLGRPGGQGVVYLCFDEHEQRRVAIKVLNAGLIHSAEDQRRVEGEIGFLETVDHANILGIERHFYIAARGSLPPTIAYVMQRAIGSLADLVGATGCQDKALGRAAMTDALCGIAECHLGERLHNDICEANILQFVDRFALTDFGVSIQLPPGVTTEKSVWGQDPYVPPDVDEHGRREVSREGDLWSWAVTWVHVLTGEFPRFRGDGKDPLLPSRLRGKDRKIAKLCLRYERKKRPQNLEVLFRRLPARRPRQVTQHDVGVPQGTSTRPLQRRKTSLRTRVLVSTVLFVLVMAVAIAASIWWSSPADQPAQTSPPTTSPVDPPPPAPVTAPAPTMGYWVTAADGGVFSQGTAPFVGALPGTATVSDIVDTAVVDSAGYREVAKDGSVFDFGNANYFGSLPGSGYQVDDIVGIANSADNGGFWVLGADGTIWPFGDAPSLNWEAPTDGAATVAIAATPDGEGFWVAFSDGSVYTFGDAKSFGSAAGSPLDAPIVAMAATADGSGYWLVAADGGVFNFGDAGFYGSMGGKPLNQPVVAIAPTPDEKGYWLVAADGGIFAFGDASSYGSVHNDLSVPAVGIATYPGS